MAGVTFSVDIREEGDAGECYSVLVWNMDGVSADVGAMDDDLPEEVLAALLRINAPALPDGWKALNADSIHISVCHDGGRGGAEFAQITREGVNGWMEIGGWEESPTDPSPEVRAYLEHQWSNREVV
jgi:hypothetical protein